MVSLMLTFLVALVPVILEVPITSNLLLVQFFGQEGSNILLFLKVLYTKAEYKTLYEATFYVCCFLIKLPINLGFKILIEVSNSFFHNNLAQASFPTALP